VLHNSHMVSIRIARMNIQKNPLLGTWN
jgi:hypothetical protein